MPEITGGCLCGRVRYTVTGEPAFSSLCHCRNCQRYTGSAFETVIAFPTASVNVHGELKTYADTGDSGKPVYRRFCPNCGSGVIAEADVLPGVMLVLAGTLDVPDETEILAVSAACCTTGVSHRYKIVCQQIRGIPFECSSTRRTVSSPALGGLIHRLTNTPSTGSERQSRFSDRLRREPTLPRGP